MTAISCTEVTEGGDLEKFSTCVEVLEILGVIVKDEGLHEVLIVGGTERNSGAIIL